jgi:hypothetical protein
MALHCLNSSAILTAARVTDNMPPDRGHLVHRAMRRREHGG